jgi:hypothetical protein
VIHVAKPIEPTPVLEGEDIKRFYETMRKEESNPDPKRIELIAKGQDVFSKIARK